MQCSHRCIMIFFLFYTKNSECYQNKQPYTPNQLPGYTLNADFLNDFLFINFDQTIITYSFVCIYRSKKCIDIRYKEMNGKHMRLKPVMRLLLKFLNTYIRFVWFFFLFWNCFSVRKQWRGNAFDE